MTGWVDLANFAISSGGLVASILGLALALSMPYLALCHRRYLATTFALIVAYMVSTLVDQLALAFGDPTWAWLSRAGVFLESAFSSMLMPLLTSYLLRCVGNRNAGRVLMRAVTALWLAYVALLVFAQFGETIYYVAPDNTYHRGPLYPVLLVPPALLMLLNVVALVRWRNALSRRQFLAFAIYLGVPLACMLAQMMAYGLLMIVIGTAASALAMLGFVLRDQVDAHVARREEAARQRARVMALQMRPHFIYNVLTSIYYLCRQDPDRAQQVTLDFTDYLRRNFNAVAREGMVPFSEELAHTTAYLAVERARFDDALEVELDCDYDDFLLPPLTLQPLVENAVRHGMDPDEGMLHVWVRTRATELGAEVVVSDDGPGFDADAVLADAGENDEWGEAPTSALRNVRERIEARGGSLEVTSVLGKGTRVRIVVPSRS